MNYTERRLRRMLAIQYCGPLLLYTDDGELQDNRGLPMIDFLRDSPDVITQKMWERGANMAPPPQPSEPVANCTEPDRASCPRKCSDFCNAAELRKIGEPDPDAEPVAQAIDRKLEEVAASFINSFDQNDRLTPAYVSDCILTHRTLEAEPVAQVGLHPEQTESERAAFNSHVRGLDGGWTYFASTHSSLSGKEYEEAFIAGYRARDSRPESELTDAGAEFAVMPHEAQVQEIFRKNCRHYAGNYEVSPGDALQIAKALLAKAFSGRRNE